MILSWRRLYLACAFVVCSFGASAGAESKSKAPLLRLAEVHTGIMAADESCAIVYTDGTFLYEKFLRHRSPGHIGFDPDTISVKEGRVTADTLNRLLAITGEAEFRELKSPQQVRRIADEDYWGLYIAVFRDGEIQELNYANKASRKSHEQYLKPLLEVWKQLHKSPGQSIKNPTRTRCVPQS